MPILWTCPHSDGRSRTFKGWITGAPAVLATSWGRCRATQDRRGLDQLLTALIDVIEACKFGQSVPRAAFQKTVVFREYRNTDELLRNEFRSINGDEQQERLAPLKQIGPHGGSPGSKVVTPPLPSTGIAAP
jgi:hypothetical protein